MYTLNHVRNDWSRILEYRVRINEYKAYVVYEIDERWKTLVGKEWFKHSLVDHILSWQVHITEMIKRIHSLQFAICSWYDHVTCR